jgi:NAD kinase
LILPISTTITIKKPEDNRSSAWVSLDGATRFELKDGEELEIEGSECNLSFVVNPTDNIMDLWGQRLANKLNWNQRNTQKPLQKKNL